MRTYQIIMLSIVLLLIVGCKAKTEENVLAGTINVEVAQSKEAQEDISAPAGRILHEKALQSENAIDECNKIDNGLRKAWCLQDLADTTDSSNNAKNICSMISEQQIKDDCLSTAARRLGDGSLCESITNTESKAICLGALTGKCDQIDDEQDRELCMEG